MNNKSISILLLVIFSALACGNNNTDKLVGTWYLGHQPIAYAFKADNTYEELLVVETSEVTATGTWSLEGDQLTLTPQGGDKQSFLITFKDNTFYLGDFESDYKNAEDTFGELTKDEYFKEFGYTK